MVQKKNNRFIFNVVNNSPEELIEIKIPENWWQSQNTYFPQKTKSLKIIEIKNRRERELFSNQFPSWDIKNGDYLTNDISSKIPISPELRRKIQIYTFTLILFLSGFFSWFAAYLVSKI
ncbi:MAG: hypothetical protein AB1432_02405 [Bacteroidota bacterium]